ncbi:MAG: hypothetical protein ACYDHD_05635 [Vulcanimicrobiaceae bacterium]
MEPPPTSPPIKSSPPPIIGNNVSSNWLTTIVTASLAIAYSGVKNIIDASLTIGLKLYVLLTVLSLGWAAILGAFDNLDLPAFLRLAIPRWLESSLFIFAISNTWSGIAWLPSIITGLAAIGGMIGGQPYAVQLTSSPNLNLNLLPGTLINLGTTLYAAIVTSVTIKTQGWQWWLNALDGQALVNFFIYISGILTGITALFAMLYVAFRLWISTLKIYLLGIMTFMQGFAGSRRLTSLSGGFLSGALVLGLELAFTVAVSGLFYTIIQKETPLLNLPVAHVSSGNYCGLNIILCTGTVTVVKLGFLALINATVALFVWAVREAPRMVNDVISGRLTMTGQEAIQRLSSSNSALLRGLGHIGQTAQVGAERGAMAGIQQGIKPVTDAVGSTAKMVMIAGIGAATGGVGLAGVTEAAGMGGVLGGGFGGAMAGAAGKMAMGKMMAGEAASTEAVATEGGTISQGAEAEAGSTVQPETSNTATGQPGTEDTVGSGGDSDSAEQSASATRRVDVQTQFDDDPTEIPETNIPNATAQARRRVQVDTDVASSTHGAMGSGGASSMGSAGGGAVPGGLNNGGVAGMLKGIAPNMSLGRMFAYKMMYAAGRQQPPPPPPNEESAVININLAGNK